MATAMAFPEAKRGMHSELIGSTGRGYDKAALSRARFILRNNPPASDSEFPPWFFPDFKSVKDLESRRDYFSVESLIARKGAVCLAFRW